MDNEFPSDNGHLRPEEKKLAWDALLAITRINRFLAAAAAPRSDELIRAAVERQLDIIGEALARLVRSNPKWSGDLPGLPRIVALRHILRQGWASGDADLVWTITEQNLPGLQSRLREMIERA
jgi:uncharacterized protein with HEPN domain